jgi:origin recognition complex subunit 1
VSLFSGTGLPPDNELINIGLQTLLFQPYDRQNLIEIVQSRLIAHPKSKEEHKVLQPDAIALAATKMAGTNGDARRVLDACR